MKRSNSDRCGERVKRRETWKDTTEVAYEKEGETWEEIGENKERQEGRRDREGHEREDEG